MHKLEVTIPEAVRTALKQEAECTPHLRFAHRLHCLLLVAAGRSCYEVAEVFGDDPRTVERWVRGFQQRGIEALREKPHPGRRACLADAQMRELEVALGSAPRALGHADDSWNATVLRAEILRRFGATLSVRHCRRLLKVVLESRSREFDSRLHKLGAGLDKAPSGSNRQ